MRFTPLLLLLILSGCIPPRPKVDICTIDAGKAQLYCSNGKADYTLPLSKADMYLAISPFDFVKAESYLTNVEKKAVGCK